MRWPSLFVSHGSPLLAVEPARTGPALAAWARAQTARPNGILVISPHWMQTGLAISTRTEQAAWHDFRGFPQALYELEYAASGSPALARRVGELLTDAGLRFVNDSQRPLDHGAWIPLRFMYPRADIPVVQLSLDADRDAAAQVALGRALSRLRDEHILIVGSGSLTHNLRHVQPAHDAPALPYVHAFQDWYARHLLAGDMAALLHWAEQAPQAGVAHPHDDHLMPLYVALGAAAGPGSGESGRLATAAPRARRLNDEIAYGALAMDAYAFDEPPPV